MLLWINKSEELVNNVINKFRVFMLGVILLMLISKRKGAFFAITFVLLIVVTVTNVYCSLSPLVPVIDVSPNYNSLGEEIILTVKVLVNEESNVSVIPPQVIGVGDAVLFEEPETPWEIVSSGNLASFTWTFNATKTGNISFKTKISAARTTEDQTVILSEELSSKEVGISSFPMTSLFGFIILSLFVLLSSYFNKPKPPPSLKELVGGITGVGFIIFILATSIIAGLLAISEYATHSPLLYFGVLGFGLLIVGVISCFGIMGVTIVNEIMGLIVAASGISIFLGFLSATKEFVFIVMIVVIALYAEYLEMKAYNRK